MKRLLSTSVLMLILLNMFSISYYNVNSVKAGTLSSIVDSNVVSLRITGEINAADFKFLSVIAFDRNLKDLDLSGCKIVAYTGKNAMSYKSNVDISMTSFDATEVRSTSTNIIPNHLADEIPVCAFFDYYKTKISMNGHRTCKLETIILPKSVKKINTFAFTYCKLKRIMIPDSCTTLSKLSIFGCDSLKSITISKKCVFNTQSLYNNEQLDSLIFMNETPQIINGTVYYIKPITKAYVPCGTGAKYKSAIKVYNGTVPMTIVDNCIKTYETNTITQTSWLHDSIVYSLIVDTTKQLDTTIKTSRFSKYTDTTDRIVRIKNRRSYKISIGDTIKDSRTLSVVANLLSVSDNSVKIDSVYRIDSVYSTKYTIKIDTTYHDTTYRYDVVNFVDVDCEIVNSHCKYYTKYTIDTLKTVYNINNISKFIVKTTIETDTISKIKKYYFDTTFVSSKDSAVYSYKTKSYNPTYREELYRETDTILRTIKKYTKDSVVNLTNVTQQNHTITSNKNGTIKQIISTIKHVYSDMLTDIQDKTKTTDIRQSEGMLFVDNFNGTIHLYDISGKLLLSTECTEINISNFDSQILLVKTGDKISKIIKK